MMNIRQRTVNVNRKNLLEALKQNRAKHVVEYQDALIAFKTRLLSDLKAAVKKVEVATVSELKDFEIEIDFPVSHDEEFGDIIEMLEQSTDEVINIDSESFKAYFRNEWAWSSGFQRSVSNYASGSFLKG